jgi:hypothetical protein
MVALLVRWGAEHIELLEEQPPHYPMFEKGLGLKAWSAV